MWRHLVVGETLTSLATTHPLADNMDPGGKVRLTISRRAGNSKAVGCILQMQSLELTHLAAYLSYTSG